MLKLILHIVWYCCIKNELFLFVCFLLLFGGCCFFVLFSFSFLNLVVFWSRMTTLRTKM